MPQEQNIMATMPVKRLVLHMSWPIMLSMLMQAVYNLVDSIFVARISDEAFLALSYAYPIQTLMIAFCVGTGVAFAAILSKRLGEGKMEQVISVVLHGFLLFFSCWVLFFCFGLFGAAPFLRTCTDTGAVAQMGAEYLTICCCCSFGICTQFPIERILQATGHPIGFMAVQGTGAVLNLILDPIFIFHLGLGVKGAAIATVIGQAAGACLGLFLLFCIRRQLPLTLKGFRFQPQLVQEIGSVASPAILMQSLVSVMSLGLNAILRLWSETAVWVLGAYFKIQSFVFMPIFSINNALIAITSYNYGASRRDRARQAIHFGIVLAICIALGGAILLSAAVSPLLTTCFDAGQAALELGIPSLRLTALSFPIAAVSIILSAAFQSLGHSRYSLTVSLLRFVLILLPVSYVLVKLVPNLVFLSFFLTESVAALVSLALYHRVKATMLTD